MTYNQSIDLQQLSSRRKWRWSGKFCFLLMSVVVCDFLPERFGHKYLTRTEQTSQGRRFLWCSNDFPLLKLSAFSLFYQNQFKISRTQAVNRSRKLWKRLVGSDSTNTRWKQGPVPSRQQFEAFALCFWKVLSTNNGEQRFRKISPWLKQRERNSILCSILCDRVFSR